MQTEGVGHQTLTEARVDPTPGTSGPTSSRGRGGRSDKGKAILIESEEAEDDDIDSDELMAQTSPHKCFL